MSTTFHLDDWKAALQRAAAAMAANQDRLCALDGAIGDGDLGLTMSKGFQAVAADLQDAGELDFGTALLRSADVLSETVASTMGTLLASGFLAGSKVVRGREALTGPELAAMLLAMGEGIMRRGKCAPGDKTIVDAWLPAAQAATAAAESGAIAQMLDAASQAAATGAAATVGMQARQGRAARYLENSRPHEDPGAVVAALWFAALVDAPR